MKCRTRPCDDTMVSLTGIFTAATCYSMSNRQIKHFTTFPQHIWQLNENPIETFNWLTFDDKPTVRPSRSLSELIYDAFPMHCELFSLYLYGWMFDVVEERCGWLWMSWSFDVCVINSNRKQWMEVHLFSVHSVRSHFTISRPYLLAGLISCRW